jgi:hypothetical protein
MSEMHQSVSIERMCRDLGNLHSQVIRNWGRIEITASDGTNEACVLISRAELECLERALEIFCESPGGKEICKELEGIASRAAHRLDNPAAMTDGSSTPTFVANEGTGM